ncbi:HAD family hydrolase [Planctomycetota bacterium]
MPNRYGLIFDVDGVIADTETVNRRVSVQVFNDLFNVPDVRPEDFNEGLGRGAHEYIKAAARVHQIDLSETQLNKAVQYRQDLFLKALQTESLPAYPGVLELIEASLASEDFEVAIATSGTLEKSRAALTAAQIPLPRMVYVNGDDVTRKKPDPALFLIAAQRMGLAPQRCVVIEDAPNGVQAAKAAGALCIAVTNTTPAQALTQADRIYGSLTQVDLDTLRALIDATSD